MISMFLVHARAFPDVFLLPVRFVVLLIRALREMSSLLNANAKREQDGLNQLGNGGRGDERQPQLHTNQVLSPSTIGVWGFGFRVSQPRCLHPQPLHIGPSTIYYSTADERQP